MMKKLMLSFMLFFTLNAYAASLQPTDLTLIETAGIPIFSKAIFVYGNKDIGFRFASSTPPKEVQKWYRQQLADWSLLDKYGHWILYDGKPGIGMGELMSKNQISIKLNEDLPQWHSLEKSMTTEIVIMIPR